ADQAIGELPGLDRERRDVASDLFGGLVLEHDLEDALAVLVGTATNEHDEVGRDRDRRLRRRGHREHDPGQVDACGGSGYRPEFDVLGEEGRDDVHRVGTLPGALANTARLKVGPGNSDKLPVTAEEDGW